MRINNYNRDTNVVANDKWIGSDFNNNGETKNFTPTNLAAYYNHNQVIDSPYLKFTYQTLLPGEVRAEGTISFVSEIGPSVSFSSINTFLVSNKSLKGNTISQYLNFLNGGKIILSNGENINDFGFYKISNIQSYIPDPNFFTVTLQFISGNGSMLEDKDYIVSLLVDSQTVNSVVTRTSSLTNDGENGINPFISALALTPYLLSSTAASTYFPKPTGTTSQYLRGDGSLATFPSITTQTLNQVLTAGNASLLDAKIGSLYLYDQTEFDYGRLSLNDSDFSFSDVFGQAIGMNRSAIRFSGLLGGFSGTIELPIVTANRTYTLPNASGTIALISDIPSLNGYVPYTGATSSVNIGVNSIIADNGVNNTEMSPSYFGVQNAASTTYGLLEFNQLTLVNPTSSMAMTAAGITFPNASVQVTAFPPTGGIASQYIKGDGTLATFPTIPSVTPSALTKVDDTNVTLTLGGTPSTALLQGVSLTLGWAGTLADIRIASASNWNTAYTNRIVSLTTTGSSGSASLISNALNIPTYTLSGLGGVPTSRTLTINGTAYDFSADRSWTVGTITSVSATGPITSSGGTTPTISTSMATNKLIGRSTAGTGVMEEITIGTGLTLSAGTLSATATGGGIPHATAGGTDTYTATVTGVTSYADGDAYLIRFTNGNTTVCTLNINALGAIPLYRNNDGQLIGGDIISNGEMLCVYNSTTNIFQCIGTAPNTLLSYVTNADSVTLTKGMAVYAFGGTGDRMTVKRASNNGDSTSAQTVGLVLSTSIAVNQRGIIVMQGLLDGLSILPTSTFADGDPVYLGSTAGSITKIKPYAPNHLVYLGVVTTASPGASGRMYVRVQNGYELDELHNVQAQSPSLKDTLWYDNTVTPAQWKTASISTILGYTPFNLPSLTSGSVLFSNGTTIAQDNANFFWDDTNNRLGLGTSAPTNSLTIQDSSYSQIVLKSSANSEGISSFLGGNLASFDTIYGFGRYQYGALTMIPSYGFLTYLGYEVLTGNITTGYIPRKAPIGVENSLIYDNGTNVGIGTTSPSGKLHINGSMYLQNSTTGIESITFSNGPQIESNGPSSYFKSGNVYTETTSIGNVGINNSAPDDSAMLDVTSTEKGFLPPRMTTSQRNLIAFPATGLIVYDTILLSLYQYNGTAWTAVGGGGGGSNPVKLTSQTLAVGSWTLSGGYYTYAFSNVNIDTTCDVSVTPQNASYLTAYNAQVLPFVGVAAGVATFYSQFPPQANMVVDIVITQTT